MLSQHIITSVTYRNGMRRAFSMLELLGVISLILLLMAILVFTLGNSLGTARITATQTTLLKIDGMLQQRMQAFRTSLETPQWQHTLKQRVAAKQRELREPPYNVDVVPAQIAELLVLKDALRRAFPQSLVDNSALGGSGQPFAGNAQNSAESAEMLYWIITKSDSYGVPPVDDSEFSTAEIGDTDNDGRLEFIDNWGEPLRFYRWPTRLVRPEETPGSPDAALDPINRDVASVLITGLPSAPTTGDANPLSQDPEDRLGVYVAAVNGNNFAPAVYEAAAHTPDTYWISLVVSSGPDRELGLFEPSDTANYGRLAQPTAATMADFANSALMDNLSSKQKQK